MYSKQSFRRSLNKLAKPRTPLTLEPLKSSEIKKILKKCKRLMVNGNKFKAQMSYFEKSSRLCLSSIQHKMQNLVSDGLTENYYT